jgi:hypothetical protein
MKVKVVSRIARNNETIQLVEVSKLVISNFGATESQFRINAIERVLPAFDTKNNVPVGSFVVDACTNTFDLEIEFRTTNSKVVLDFIQHPIVTNQC